MTEIETGKRILLVEDNEKILHGNQVMLEWEGYHIDTASTLAEARLRLSEHRPDCIVLDIMLPDGSGLDFTRELREVDRTGVPILLLTGLTTHEDILRGLKSGGDDYLTKPYDFEILLARIEALLRRAERVPESIVRGRLTMDISANVATLDGADLPLTQKEFALLLIFAQNPNRCIDGEALYERVWKQSMGRDSKALKTALARLRSKISGCGWVIVPSRGKGYCFERE